MQIVLAGGYSTVDLTEGNTTSEFVYNYETTATMIIASGGLHYFLGNSFAMGAGVGYRKIDIFMGFQDTNDETLFQEFDATSNSVFAYFDIANMWIFNSGFYIKPTWLGYQASISNSGESTTSNTLTENEEFNKASEEVSIGLQEIGEINVVYFMLTVGFLF